MHKTQLSLRYTVNNPVKSQTYTLLYLRELLNNFSILVPMDTEIRKIKMARNL
jgi:hypothetical protein